MADRDPTDTNEPETSPEAVPNGDNNHEIATKALGQSNEREDVSDTVQSENGTATKVASGEKMDEDEVMKERENDTESHRDARRKKDNNFHSNRRNNKKFDPSVKGVSSDAQGIRNLVAFYFSDSNLATDEHLRGLIDGTTNNPVKIKHIHTFNRLKQYQPYSAVVAALRESDLFDVTGLGGLEEIRRKTPYNPQRADESASRSIYAKGFGEETATTQFDAEDFFAPFGPVNSVRLRRDKEDNSFKGSCFVEFKDKETFQKFIDLDPKPLWQGKHELKIMSKPEYLAEKNIMIRDGKMDPNTSRHYRGRGRGGKGKGFRGDRDPDDWKKRRESDQKSGFRDNRNGRDNRNRNGFGRGRGADRHGRNNDRNQERRDRDQSDSKDETDTKAKPHINFEADDKVDTDTKAEKDVQGAEIKPEELKTSKKREREDDTETGGAPVKKVDSKEEVSQNS